MAGTQKWTDRADQEFHSMPAHECRNHAQHNGCSRFVLWNICRCCEAQRINGVRHYSNAVTGNTVTFADLVPECFRHGDEVRRISKRPPLCGFRQPVKRTTGESGQ